MQETVWTPTRDSPAVLAFMAILRMDSPDWRWVDRPEAAACWVIDANADINLQSLGQQHDTTPAKPKVALLATHLSQLPRPGWTFFKPPVPSGMVFNWVRPATPDQDAVHRDTPPACPPDQPWKQGLLRLRRWPNVARYGPVLELTVACSRLLAAPATYKQVLQWNVPAGALDQMLEDALHQGALELQPIQTDLPGAPAQPSAPSSDAPKTHWGLVRRLLQKFSSR